MNFTLAAKMQSLDFLWCHDLSLKSVSAKKCDIGFCKNLQIDDESGDIEHLTILDCPDVSLDHLPKTTQTLELMGCKNLSSLETLPDHLKELRITNCTLIIPFLDYLPKGLEDLSLDFSGLPNLSLDDLPSGLQKLVLRKSAKIPSLDRLPQNLKGIEFDDCDLTNISFDSLPDHLTSIIFNNCRGVSLNQLPPKFKNKVLIK